MVHLGSVYSLGGQKGRMQMLYLWSSLYLVIRSGFRKIYITGPTHTPRIFGSVEKSYRKVLGRLSNRACQDAPGSPVPRK